jgi:trans-aconitate methyltransferase
MKKAAEDYYAELTQDYDVKIRQLVPRYDEMVECVIDLVVVSGPRTALDIGAGNGVLSGRVLRAVSELRITAVEASGAMVAEARRRHGSHANRIETVQTDILDFAPHGSFDAIFSNLVLHNLPSDAKRRLLAKLKGWLNPGGAFIWGDLIRHPDDRVQERLVDYRKNFAREAGCPAELVELNFNKEGKEDYPLTVEATLAEARCAGFEAADPIWVHGTFAVFCLG